MDILTMIGVFVVFLFIFTQFKNNKSSPKERKNIRQAKLKIKEPPTRALQKIEQYAERQDWIKNNKLQDNIIILESLPGFVTPGFFFRIQVENLEDNNLTLLDIGCRPRVPKLWYWFGTKHTNRLKEELKQEFDNVD